MRNNMNIKSPNLLLPFLAPEYGLGVRNTAGGFVQQLSLGQESAATCHPSLYILRSGTLRPRFAWYLLEC